MFTARQQASVYDGGTSRSRRKSGKERLAAAGGGSKNIQNQASDAGRPEACSPDMHTQVMNIPRLTGVGTTSLDCAFDPK